MNITLDAEGMPYIWLVKTLSILEDGLAEAEDQLKKASRAAAVVNRESYDKNFKILREYPNTIESIKQILERFK